MKEHWELFDNYYAAVRRNFMYAMHEADWNVFESQELSRKENELREQIIALGKNPDIYDEVTLYIEDRDPDVFSEMIANLDSNQNVETLYDLICERNTIHGSKVCLPENFLKMIKIRRD